MNNSALLRLAKRRAQQLRIDPAEVLDAGVLGSYHYAPLSLVEYCMHEAAHLITLGFHPHQFKGWLQHLCPAHLGLPYALGKMFDNMSNEAANLLEIDASIVTFLAGLKLGLWRYSQDIQDSCLRNLSGGATSAGRTRVREAFLAAVGDELVEQATAQGDTRYHRQADTLARWFEGRSKMRKKP